MVRSTGQDTAPWVGCGQEYRSGHCPVGWMWSEVWVRTLPRGLDVVRSTGQDTAPWVRCGHELVPVSPPSSVLRQQKRDYDLGGVES